MSTLRYPSGDEVRAGDRVRYHGDVARVQFVVTDRVGDPALDWYVEQYPTGGFMMESEQFGKVFLPSNEIDESLQLITRDAKQ